MIEAEIVPAVRVADGPVELDVKLPKLIDPGRLVVRIVNAVVRLRQPFLCVDHQLATVSVERVSRLLDGL